jgi:hypothetical protein
MAHRPVGLHVLRDLGQRECPALLAAGLGLSVAQVQELAVFHVAPDSLGYWRFVLREHHARIHDLQDAGVPELPYGVASDVLHTN